MKTTEKKYWTAVTLEDEYELFTFSGLTQFQTVLHLMTERNLKRQNVRITYYEAPATELFTFEGEVKLP